MKTAKGVESIAWRRLYSVLDQLKKLRFGKEIPFDSNEPEDVFAIERIIDKGYDIEAGFVISFSDDYEMLNKGNITGFGKMEDGLWVEKKLFRC